MNIKDLGWQNGLLDDADLIEEKEKPRRKNCTSQNMKKAMQSMECKICCFEKLADGTPCQENRAQRRDGCRYLVTIHRLQCTVRLRELLHNSLV